MVPRIVSMIGNRGAVKRNMKRTFNMTEETHGKFQWLAEVTGVKTASELFEIMVEDVYGIAQKNVKKKEGKTHVKKEEATPPISVE